MRVGFTGTQQGLTLLQKSHLAKILADLAPSEFHHGDCIGADVQTAMMMQRVRRTFADTSGEDPETDRKIKAVGHCKIICHPPTNSTKRAFFRGNDVVLPEKDYLDRNHDIVQETQVLVACPKGPEELRSGTWATIRHARKLLRPIYIIYPDGEVVEYNT